nr:[FeFe] hydrogenase, group A [uncultured Holophaga sp.]
MTTEKTLTIDGMTVAIQDEKNLLEVIRKAHIELPTFCYHSELSVYGACRLCMVEVEGRGLVASCSTPPEPGLKLRTQTPQIRELRKMNIELLLASGNHDCPTCSKSGSCKLQSLAERLGVTKVRFKAPVQERPLDTSSPSLQRDPSKCILCGDCVRFCEEIQGIGAIGFTHRGSQSMVAPAFGKGLAEVDCVNCGQCAAVCPVGAITVKPETESVFAALGDPSKTVIVQVAPAVRSAIGELFGVPNDTFTTMGRIVAALRRLGFRKVYDTSFTADLTIWEEATEFLSRKEKGGRLPLFTSCCPAWVKLVEHDLPEMLDNLSTCRSPQGMFGSLAKQILPAELGIRREDLVVVSVMPCTAKKFEARRPELAVDGQPDTDFVITTQELARMIQDAGILFPELPVESLDMPFGFKTGAGVLFANSGGVTEAVVRYVAGQLGEEHAVVRELRSDASRRVFEAATGAGPVRMAVVHGLAEAQRLVKEIQAGTVEVDFVEVMACPGGCVGGAGQPVAHSAAVRRQRSKAIHQIDAALDLHCPQENHHIQALYAKHLGAPNSGEAHHLLHTHYQSRRRILGETIALSPITGIPRIPVSFCVGTACHLRGAEGLLRKVLASLETEGIREHFELKASFCAESCDRGPTVTVAGNRIHHATEESVMEFLRAELESRGQDHMES